MSQRSILITVIIHAIDEQKHNKASLYIKCLNGLGEQDEIHPLEDDDQHIILECLDGNLVLNIQNRLASVLCLSGMQVSTGVTADD